MTYRNAGAEEYLEAIYQLQELGEDPTTSRLAEWLGVALPSVSQMLRRLADQGFIDYEPYRSIGLTGEGSLRASRLLRRQRLWEVFLYEHLGVPWHRIFREACSLEHGTTELTETRLGQFLGHPTVCPHGYPIPKVQSRVPSLRGTPLVNMAPGQSGTVRRIPEQQEEILAYLESRGIMPGAQLTVAEKAPQEGQMIVWREQGQLSLPLTIAATIVIDPPQE